MKYKLTHSEIKIKQVLTSECVKQLNAYSPWMKLDQKSSEAYGVDQRQLLIIIKIWAKYWDEQKWCHKSSRYTGW